MGLRTKVPRPVRAVLRALLRIDPPTVWRRRGHAMPAPNTVKWAVLHRYGFPAGTWIETGTFLGDTTAFLARSARAVYSIEPGPALASAAQKRFARRSNVTIVQGLSEDALDGLMTTVDGPLSLWLDGHYSAGITHRGPQDTPIREELAVVERHLNRFPDIAVLIDDVRCFDPSKAEFSQYPTRAWLVHWAERNRLSWTIEHDIFVAAREIESV